MMVALLFVLVVAVALGFVIKRVSVKDAAQEAASMQQLVTEKYTDNSFTRSHKNSAYNAYIKYFYSSGGSVPDIMFSPSVTDIACSNFTNSLHTNIICGASEGAAPLDSLSIRDDRAALGYHMYDVCASREAATGPLDPQDARLRILNGTYSLRKTCVKVPYVSITQQNNQSSGDLAIELPVESPATLFIMLTRPVFVVANQSQIYYATYQSLQAGYKYGYSDAGSATTMVYLSPVTDALMYKVGTQSRKRPLDQLYVSSPGETNTQSGNTNGSPMHLTLYYLNFEHPVRRGLSDFQFDTYHVLTLVFPLSKSRLGNKNLMWFSNEFVTVQYNNESRRAAVTAPGLTVKSAELGYAGYLVVVYCYDTLTVCYLSNGKVSVVRKNTKTPLSMSASQKQSVNDDVTSKGFAPPALCYPCQMFNIPNLYDMYTKLTT